MPRHKSKQLIIILHNIRSLYNVGSIFRTADAVGAEKIYLTGITPEPIDVLGRWRQRLTKVSLGAEKSLAWEKQTSLTRVIKRLGTEGFNVIALEQSPRSKSPKTIIKSLKKSSKIALIAGSETKGLAPGILKVVDYILELPMAGQKESLNVAVALGVAAYLLNLEL